MGIIFKINNVVSSTAPIKWKFVDHPTIWFSLPGNFENNIVVKAHYLGLPLDTKVEILNGEVLNCSRVVKPKEKEQPEIVTYTTTLPPIEEEKITKSEDDNTTCFTTTLAPESDSVSSDSVADPQPDLPEGTSAPSSLPIAKRKANRKTS